VLVTVQAVPDETDAAPQLVMGNAVLSPPYSVPLMDMELPHPTGRIELETFIVEAAKIYPLQGAVKESDMVYVSPLAGV
jgi:hypothetical protein